MTEPDPSATPTATEVDTLRRLAERIAGAEMAAPVAMAGGGSSRRYYRIRSRGPVVWGPSVIGVITRHLPEARAFEGFTRHLLGVGIPVPQHFGHDVNAGMYLVEDLGDLTLSDRLRSWRTEGAEGARLAMAALRSVMELLAQFQIRGARKLDPTLCFDGSELGGDAFRADLRLFFTQYVPRFVVCPGPDEATKDDMDRLVAMLDGLDRRYLCHRDFQTRNIMWPGDRPILLDYQGARFGPLAYDLASILYSPDTGLNESERAALVNSYFEQLDNEGAPQDSRSFLRDFHAVVLVRRLQALGAYARIAVQEGKPEYLNKIPAALDTLQSMFTSGQLTLGLPHLEAWLLRALAPEGVAIH